jgi:hypothetical protein
MPVQADSARPIWRRDRAPAFRAQHQSIGLTRKKSPPRRRCGEAPAAFQEYPHSLVTGLGDNQAREWCT